MGDAVGRKVRLYGRVQGVFFRQWTLERARALGVAGWVSNRSDGSVEAHLEGDEAVVDELVEQMRSGPSQARVDDLVSEPAEPQGIEGFSVRL